MSFLRAISFCILAVSLSAADQPQWGQAWSRNMVSAERGLPAEFDPRNYLGPAREAITSMVKRKLHVLNSAGKADEINRHWEKLGRPLPKYYSKPKAA